MKHESFVRDVNYNMMIGRSIIKSFLLFAFGLVKVRSKECVSPLGMADRRIRDSQITTSSVIKERTPYGWQARLNQNIPGWGAWCPDITEGKINEKNYDQYIQIDLLNLTKITGIATQGRAFSNGREHAKDYKISYKIDGGVWNFYREKNQTLKIFKGNTDVSTVVQHNLDPAIMARYIRVHPGYYTGTNVCMRLELYGCVPVIEKAILSYSMPVGQTIKNGKVTFDDTSYNGVIENDICKNGTGILTDGKFGLDDAKQDKGKGWVGWSSILTTSSYVDITFEFSGVRKFKDVTLTVNVDKSRSYAVFDRSEIFFASKESGFSDTSFLQYCPQKSENSNTPYSRNITLLLCENMAMFIKLRLYFGGIWLLITEISFNSVPVDGNEKTSFQHCMKGACMVTQFSTTSSALVPFTTSSTSTSECSNCPTEAPGSTEAKDSSDSNNLQMTIIIICVILLIVILLLVIIFLLYRRRAFCFGKMKQRQKTDKNVHVELQNVESGHEVQYDKIDDNIGNPLYASVGGNEDDTHPMLSPVKKKENEFFPETDKRESELYSEPNMADAQPPKQEDYAEPVDTLQPTEDPDELLANPIYEGIYSEPLYGIAGTILVGPQEETLKRGYTMEKFPRDRLVFKEKIGDGQFGEVHIAEADLRDLNTQFGEEYAGKTKITVAVKTLKGDVKNDAKTDFFKEVRVMSRLQHENVVRLLAVCRDDPICMIVEYMENGDLNQFLKGHVLEDDDDAMIYANTKQPISYGELIYIASQVAAGMKYFAAMNFVHRDLAARNCLVGEGLTVKLADFGMSRLLYSKHYYRVQGRVMLPIRWMAPESIFQGRFTTQTDVWSFGITLWEIFTLAQDFPYPNLPDEQIIGNAKAAFKHGTGVIYNEKPDVCPQDVFDMMMLCWSSDPAQRPNFNTLYDFLMAKVGSVESAVV